ncbi:glycine/sarcosine/betaine reductase selenoprotein B family protein [Mesobacillus zeae]|uniref:glycine/sarcosine/betaine reductase selenoprotein B family protein n=1 Tax=Mesobacillus zeae TaxID=1917180 RepID=UPI0015E6D3FD|nr:glycine/sarcosine/betaine reductase selenoprotein B family protein [Mesobacillus zeae]
MSLYYKLRSKVAIGWSKYFPKSYKKFTLSNTRVWEGPINNSLQKPLSQCRVALLTSAGVHLQNDAPFNVETLDGDHSYRIIPPDTQHSELKATHIYYDTKHANIDISIVFPLEQLKELEGHSIHAVSNCNFGLNGGTLNHEPHEKITAPKVADILKKDRVDIAFLVPG